MKAEINICVMFGILIIHGFADFVLQTVPQAEQKHKSIYFLTQHVLVYTMVWIVCCFVYAAVRYHYSWETNPLKWLKFVILFPLITFVCHWITDFFTSKMNANLSKKKDYHNLFVSIETDQLLHYTQLFITFQLLTQ